MKRVFLTLLALAGIALPARACVGVAPAVAVAPVAFEAQAAAPVVVAAPVVSQAVAVPAVAVAVPFAAFGVFHRHVAAVVTPAVAVEVGRFNRVRIGRALGTRGRVIRRRR